jgi:hypothetical protein
VIALERKQYGDNLGMADVIKLANIISHNEKHPHDKITIPEEINSSLIYQDAMLYKTAQENGITVIGIEGKGLDTNKNSPDYDAKREEHMSKVLEEVSKSGHNILLSIGSDHVESLKTSLEHKGLKTKVVQDISKIDYSKEQQLESKSTKFTDKIKLGYNKEQQLENKSTKFTDKIKQQNRLNGNEYTR